MTRLVKKIASVPSLTREYNRRGRHPLQGIKRVYHEECGNAGNVRFGVPLATVAVIAGALSYALVDTPTPRYTVPVTQTSAVALSAVEPASGGYAPAGPQPVLSRNGELMMDLGAPPSDRKLITVNDLDDAGVLADEAGRDIMAYDDTLRAEVPFGTAGGAPVRAPIMSAENFYDEPSITTAVYRAPQGTAASHAVSVQRKAVATDHKAMLASAERALSQARYDAAMEIYETLRRDRPSDVRVLMGLAVAQQRFGLHEAAQHTYESVLAFDPQNTEATVNLLGLMQNDRPEEAHEKLAGLWANNPRSAPIAAQLGLVSAQMGKTDDAMRYVGIAASLEPNNAGHLYNMAVITDRKGGHRRAIELYQKALEIDAAHGAGKSVPRDLIYDRLYYLRRL